MRSDQEIMEQLIIILKDYEKTAKLLKLSAEEYVQKYYYDYCEWLKGNI